MQKKGKQLTQQVCSYEILWLQQQHEFTILPATGHNSSLASVLLMFGIPIFNSDQFNDPIYSRQIKSCNCPDTKQSGKKGKKGTSKNCFTIKTITV